MTTDSSGVRLGDLLTGAGLLQAADLREAMLISKQQGLPVGRVLIMSGFLTEGHLQAAVQAQSLLKDGLIDFETVIKALSMVGTEELSLDEAFRKLKYKHSSDAITNKLGELLMAAEIVPVDTLNSALLQCQSIGLPLGRVLVASGAMTEQMLAAALNVQVFIRDKKLSREQAISCLRSAKERQIPIEQYLAETGALQLPTVETVRLGELFVLANIIDEPSLMGAVEVGLLNDKPIGEVLVQAKLVTEEMLTAALELQKMVAAGAIRKSEAGSFLLTVQKKGIPVQEAVKKPEPAAIPSPAALNIAPEGLPLYQFLQLSGIITSKQIEQAIRIGSKDSEIMGKMLLLAGFLETPLLKCAKECNELIGTGVLTTEQGMIALKSCERNQFTLEQAFAELGWDTSQLKVFAEPGEILISSPPPVRPIESFETKTLEAVPALMPIFPNTSLGSAPVSQAANDSLFSQPVPTSSEVGANSLFSQPPEQTDETDPFLEPFIPPSAPSVETPSLFASFATTLMAEPTPTFSPAPQPQAPPAILFSTGGHAQLPAPQFAQESHPEVQTADNMPPFDAGANMQSQSGGNIPQFQTPQEMQNIGSNPQSQSGPNLQFSQSQSGSLPQYATPTPPEPTIEAWQSMTPPEMPPPMPPPPQPVNQEPMWGSPPDAQPQRLAQSGPWQPPAPAAPAPTPGQAPTSWSGDPGPAGSWGQTAGTQPTAATPDPNQWPAVVAPVQPAPVAPPSPPSAPEPAAAPQPSSTWQGGAPQQSDNQAAPAGWQGSSQTNQNSQVGAWQQPIPVQQEAWQNPQLGQQDWQAHQAANQQPSPEQMQQQIQVQQQQQPPQPVQQDPWQATGQAQQADPWQQTGQAQQQTSWQQLPQSIDPNSPAAQMFQEAAQSLQEQSPKVEEPQLSQGPLDIFADEQQEDRDKPKKRLSDLMPKLGPKT